MIYFAGSSFAPTILREAAIKKGFIVAADPAEANLIFISEDTPTSEDGKRNTWRISKILEEYIGMDAVLVLTSQVEPGFTRRLNAPIYHMAETLRIKDAMERALHPEMFIVGCEHPEGALPKVFLDYLIAFNCAVYQVTYEEAEFAKIAINCTLAAQVDNTNRLADAAKLIGADWQKIAMILRNDRRIGPHSYLEPGDWQDSPHILRDMVSLEAILSNR